MKGYIYKVLIGIMLLGIFSCQDFLEEEINSQYDPDTFLQDQSGVDALLTGAYSAIAVVGYFHRDNYLILGEFPTDMTWETGGGLEREVTPIIDFNWDPSLDIFNREYNDFYNGIARANNVLLVAKGLQGVDEENIDQIEGESRFVRAFGYYMLHNLFGPTPIIEIPPGVSLDSIENIAKSPRPSEQEYRDYVESDLLFAVEKLKTGGEASRANKGAALALLTKFYLNNKQWEKAAKTAEEVIDMGYSLYDDYENMFSVDGEDNNEFIFMFECLIGSSKTNVYMAHTFPPKYPIQDNWENFGAQIRTYTAFYETFDNQDIRKKLLLDKYVKAGESDTTELSRDAQGNPLNDVRSFKYKPDPNANGAEQGNNIPYVRLSDIILARAEALNQLNGPNQESINLINRIRERAGIAPIKVSDYPDKQSLNNLILAERGREFFSEGLRREDLIRHNKFIQQAEERGIQAEKFQELYPIPQEQIDANPNLKQNTGYN